MENDTPTIKATAFVANNKNETEELQNDQTELVLQKNRPHKKKNALLMPWMIIILITIMACAGFIAWIELEFATTINQNISDRYQKEYIENVSAIINNSFSNTQKELDDIAKNTYLQDALILQDSIQLTSQASVLGSSFKNLASFQIIPWDLSGTAGLGAHNIVPRNNIELMLLSQSGRQKTPGAEAYLYDKTWLISFSTPVIRDKTVIGVLLLTFNKNYLIDIINTPAFTQNAKLKIALNNKAQQAIIELGEGSIKNSSKTPLSFTNGILVTTFNAEKMTSMQTSYTPMYIAVGFVAGLIFIVCIMGYRLSFEFIKKDGRSICNYIESLSALHKTRQPELNNSILVPVLVAIDALSERTTKSNLTAETKDNYKSPQASRPPEKIGQATVGEKNSFEYPEIFKDYDIRGIATTQLNSDTMVSIGKAIGSQAMALGIKSIVTARDGRVSSEKIQYDLSRGIISTGCDVINLGQIPSPVLYFAIQKMNMSAGVMVTGSHNPAEYNGLKITLDNKALRGQEIQNLLKRIENYDFVTGQGKVTRQEITHEYIQAVSSDIIIAKPLKVVIDGCNGVGGEIGTQLLTMLDCEVTSLFCNVDGTFPNHGPDPSVRANLTDLVNKVQEIQADLGIAFDGDADRMVAVTASGDVISGDQLLMLFAKDIVSRNAGSNIIYDVKCSRNVEKIVSQYGGRAIMTKSGHSNIKAKMQESGALLGGELTGHFYFKERWYGFDDGIYAALRLIELLTTNNSTLDSEVAALPKSEATPELHIPLENIEQARDIVTKIHEALSTQLCKIDMTDGLRAEFDKGWGLVRPSNTSSNLSVRFEAETVDELARIQSIFKTALTNLKLNLTIPF